VPAFKPANVRLNESGVVLDVFIKLFLSKGANPSDRSQVIRECVVEWLYEKIESLSPTQRRTFERACAESGVQLDQVLPARAAA
jgi:hypothetical protein